MSRIGAEHSWVDEKCGYVMDIPDVEIIDDGMVVIKMKAIVKMIGVGEDQQEESQNSDDQHIPVFFVQFHNQGI